MGFVCSGPKEQYGEQLAAAITVSTPKIFSYSFFVCRLARTHCESDRRQSVLSGR